MKKLYSAKTIEKKWQEKWEKEASFQADEASSKQKCLILDMFPYPSGDGLHVGHVENYTATDVYARFKRARGFSVLHPIGWDAFGLPAENFAIKTGVHPDEKTHQNIANFTRQIQSLGISYDWSREIDTSSPEYYRWTQWFFLLLYKKGLAYRKQASVNWCPSCQTVLANEQVIGGECDRCKTVVIQKDLKQWFFKITDFIESQSFEGRNIAGLLDGLESVDWPESTKKAQKHWIGRSEGVVAVFAVSSEKHNEESSQTSASKIPQAVIEVFTTRVDTIFGCTYVVIAPEHPLVQSLAASIANYDEVAAYLETTKKKTELERTELSKEKTGVKLEGIKALHPLTGDAVPVYVADYVLGNYGTGAVMAVPAHDERDYAFAKKCRLPIRSVIEPITGTIHDNEEFRRSIVAVVEDPKTGKLLSVNWGKKLGGHLFIGGGLEKDEDALACAVREIQEETGYINVELVATSETIHHHYFAASKNVYRNIEATGLHFRLVNDERKEQQLEADEKNKFTVEWITKERARVDVIDPLHRHLFDVFIDGKIYTEDGFLAHSGEYTGLSSGVAREKIAARLQEKNLGGTKVNYRLRDWLVSRQRYWGVPIPIIYCDSCGEVPAEENTLPIVLPTDVDFRPTGESPLTRSESFHDVSCPKCGKSARRESDTMDTFVCSSWYYLRFADPHNTEVFADAQKLQQWLPVDLYMGGAEHTVLHLLYARFFTKILRKYDLLAFDEPFVRLKHQGMVLAEDGRKMSKSLGNVVNPDDVIKQFGADSLRVYEMFMGPLEDAKSWKTDNLVGPRRFLEKVWRMRDKVSENAQSSKALQSTLHKTIQKVTQDIEEFHLNTVVSSLMILANEMDRGDAIAQADFEALLQMLAPFAPHITEELWESLGHGTLISESAWPHYDTTKLIEDTTEIVVQVNGKLRGKITVAYDAPQEIVEKAAQSDEKVAIHIEGKTIKKIVFVPNRLINIVAI